MSAVRLSSPSDVSVSSSVVVVSVVVSRMDEERFVEAAEALYQNATDPKRLEVVDGSAHGQALFASGAGDAVMDLLLEHVNGVCG